MRNRPPLFSKTLLLFLKVGIKVCIADPQAAQIPMSDGKIPSIEK
jgi:hypothetical protein